MQDDDVLYRRLASCLGQLLDGATIAMNPDAGDGQGRRKVSLRCADARQQEPGSPLPQGA